MRKLVWLQNIPIIGLAPMDGWTDSAFRQICKEHGADLVFSEMIPAAGIIYFEKKIEDRRKKKAQNFFNKLYFSKLERPFVMQIFGKKPDEMAEACRILSERENRRKKKEESSGRNDQVGRLIPDEININFGCPAKNAVKSGHGVALMDNPKIAENIVRRCVESSIIPISIKMRTGWQSADEAVPFAQKMEQAGASAIYIHGRTFKQKYSGQADWQKIFEVAKAVQVPVVGNGDINSEEDRRKKIDESSGLLVGVLIGRAARGNPWVFDTNLLNMTNMTNWSNLTNKSRTIIKHANLMYQLKGEHGVIEFRKHLLHYLTGFPHASKLRQQAVKVISIEAVEQILDNIQILDSRSGSGMTSDRRTRDI